MPRLSSSAVLLSASLFCLALLASCGKSPPAIPPATPTATPTAHPQPQNPQPPLATPVPTTADAQPAAPSPAQFVQLINASAIDAADLLNTSARGTLFANADTRTNTVVLTGTPEAITRAREILQQLDKQQPEPAPSVFFICHIDNTQAQDLAPILNQIFGTAPLPTANATPPSPNGVTSPNGTPASPKAVPALTRAAYFVANPDTNSLLVTTDAHLEASVRTLIRQLDHAPTPPAPATN